MFSEYLEDIKPSDDILEKGEKEGEKNQENNESNVNNSDKKEKNDNSESKEKNDNSESKEKKEQERQAEESKAKINEWYNVLSNGYPQGFQKTLSNVEKDGKEISNILNINFGENENGEKHVSISISEREEGKESNTTSNITREFSNFQEKKDSISAPNINNQGNSQNIFPKINISKFGNDQDLGRMLSQFLGGDKNQNIDNMKKTEYLLNGTVLQQQNNVQKLIGLIDKNIMRSPISDFYGYHDHLNKALEDIAKKNDNGILETNNIKENEIYDYILNTIGKDTLNDVYKKNVFDVMLSLCIILRNSTTQEIADLKNIDTENDNEKSLLTSIAKLTNENMVEYLSTNLDFLLDSNLKNWTLQKYGDNMEIEEFNFLTP